MLLFTVVVGAFHFWTQERKKEDIVFFFPDFVAMVKEGKVKKCEVVSDGTGRQFIYAELPLPGAQKQVKRIKVDVTDGDKI